MGALLGVAICNLLAKPNYLKTQMKIKKPEQEIEVCDVCQRDGYLQMCQICHGQFCLTHRAILPGCFVSVDVCEPCGKREDVQAVIDRFLPDFKKLVTTRDAALRLLANV